jgi:ribosome-binding protein aMBF1 (putative translation factor)
MPRDWDPHYEDDEQEWEPILLKKNNIIISQSLNNTQIPLHRKIYLARSRSNITRHQLAQVLHMTICDYDMIEDGKSVPDKATLNKLRKFINLQI